MSQSCRAPRTFVFRCAFDSAKFELLFYFILFYFILFYFILFYLFLIFFACLIFLIFLYELACQKYTRKDMTGTIKHFEPQTSSTLRLVFCLVSSCSSKNQVLIFNTAQSYDRLGFDTSAAQKKTKQNKTKQKNKNKNENKNKTKQKKKKHLGQVFQSVTSFETYIFFSFFFCLIDRTVMVRLQQCILNIKTYEGIISSTSSTSFESLLFVGVTGLLVDELSSVEWINESLTIHPSADMVVVL